MPNDSENNSDRASKRPRRRPGGLAIGVGVAVLAIAGVGGWFLVDTLTVPNGEHDNVVSALDATRLELSETRANLLAAEGRIEDLLDELDTANQENVQLAYNNSQLVEDKAQLADDVASAQAQVGRLEGTLGQTRDAIDDIEQLVAYYAGWLLANLDPDWLEDRGLDIALGDAITEHIRVADSWQDAYTYDTGGTIWSVLGKHDPAIQADLDTLFRAEPESDENYRSWWGVQLRSLNLILDKLTEASETAVP